MVLRGFAHNHKAFPHPPPSDHAEGEEGAGECKDAEGEGAEGEGGKGGECKDAEAEGAEGREGVESEGAEGALRTVGTVELLAPAASRTAGFWIL